MTWITRIFLIAALCLLWVLGAMVTREVRRTPAESFAEIRKDLEGGHYDRDLMLGNLDLVVREAERAGAADVVAEACLARGRVLMELGAYERARTDLERVLETRPHDRELEKSMIELELEAGDHQRGLARVRSVLEREPTHGAALAQLGRLHQMAAQAALAQPTQKIRRTVIAEEAARAIRWVERMSAMDPTDVRRVAIGHELRRLFGVADEQLCEEVTRAADTASEELREARLALAHSLGVEFDSKAFGTLLTLYKHAGQTDHALDLGFAGLHVPAVRHDADIATFLMRTLADRGRIGAASDVASWWTNRNPPLPAEFFLDCCSVFYRAGAWPQLASAAQSVFQLGNATQVDQALLYFGAALCGGHDYSPVRIILQNYINSKALEPFPGSLAAAWRLRATAAKGLGAPDLEREALEGSLGIDPDQDGEMWIRLAELQLASPHGGYRLPEQRFAKGMSLLPMRTAELLPRWNEIGAEELKSIGMDVERVRAELAAGRIWEPTSSSGPFEIYTLGRLHLEAGDFLRARHHTRRVLEILPNFVPALDLALDIEEGEGRPSGWIETFLHRLEIVGADARNAEILRTIPIEDIEAPQMLRMMRADPEHFGRRMIARALARQGAPEEALQELELVGHALISDEERVLGARLLLDLGESQRALDLLSPVSDRLDRVDQAWGPMLEAMLATSRFTEAEDLGRLLASSPDIDRDRWLRLSDRFLAHGAADGAETLLLPLDREPRLRGGDVLARLAHASLIRGDGVQARSLLDRLHAFESNGDAYWVQIFECASDGRWDELATAALALNAKAPLANPRADALLDVLARRYALARTKINAALASTPNDAQWVLAAAAVDALEGIAPNVPPYFGSHALTGIGSFFHPASENADVRRQVCILLALEQTSSLGWARKELDLVCQRDPHSLFGVFLQAIAARERHDLGAMRAALGRVLADHPDFIPAWDGLETLLPHGPTRVAEWIDFRLRRAAALGGQTDRPAERAFDRALSQLRQGKVRVALRDANEAAALDDASGIYHWQIGRLHVLLNEFPEAIRAYSKACKLLPSAAGLASTSEFLSALEEASRPVPPLISLADRMRELEELEAHIPDDPRIIVALARVDLAQDARNPTLAVGRAYQRLDLFRARHPVTPVEMLARGSTAAWADFYLRLDPERAETFLRRELALEPGTLAAWLYAARVPVLRDDVAGAAAQFRTVERLSRDPEVLRESLSVQMSGPMSEEQLDGYVGRILAAEKRATPDATLDLLRARYYFRQGGAAVARAIEILEPLARGKDMQTSFAEEFGLLYACALNARGSPDDLAKIETLLADTANWISDPYHQILSQVLTGLSRQPSAPVAN